MGDGAATEELRDEVFTCLVGAPGASDEAALLALAALDGDEAFSEQLGGVRSVGRPAVAAPGEAVPVATDGVFLSELRVTGFRGIGIEAVLPIALGPGLTVVVGRNGSGKSSLAEALECALTGSVGRLRRNSVWREGWRNAHTTDSPSIQLSVHLPGTKDPTVLERTWAGAAFDQATSVVRRSNGSSHRYDMLGWAQALTLFSPVLSHDEIDALFDEQPSRLHDRLAGVLGLEAVDTAAQRVAEELGRRKKVVTAADAGRKELRAVAKATADERAERLAKILAKTSPDVDAATALVTDTADDDGTVAWLQRLVRQRSLDLEAIGRATATLAAALDGVRAVDTPQARQAAELADLIDRALLHHNHTASTDCAVCGTSGVLDDGWAARAEMQRDQARLQATALATARAEARDAADAVRAAVGMFEPPQARDEAEVDVSALVAAWEKLATALATGTDPGLVDELALGLVQQRDPVVQAAQAELDRRNAAWTPVAEKLGAWLGLARQARVEQPSVDLLAGAQAALNHTLSELRNRRIDHVRNEARRFWTLMRQNSNVELTDIRFQAGAAKNRRALFDVLVDGEKSAALAVMSQGELNALALALFLPRAIQPESPFRFVVIDDPVQAMDPGKVSGLARVLEEVARTRQVVVFTHDERLEHALEQLGIAATVLEVTRGEHSQVRVEPKRDEATVLLAEATQFRASKAPDELKRSVVPSLCRTALEAAFIAKYRRTRLAAGDTPDAVAEAVRRAKDTHDRAMLAELRPNAGSDELYGTLNRRYGNWAVDVLVNLKKFGHVGAEHSTHLQRLVDDTARLIRAVSA